MSLDEVLKATKKSKVSQASDTTQVGNEPTTSLIDKLRAPEKSATVRLNADIDVKLNKALAQKALELGIPKTALVRELLRWGLEQLGN